MPVSGARASGDYGRPLCFGVTRRSVPLRRKLARASRFERRVTYCTWMTAQSSAKPASEAEQSGSPVAMHARYHLLRACCENCERQSSSMVTH